jgi:hypothetical protein
MDIKKIIDSFDVLDDKGELKKFNHVTESKFEKYEKTISRNIGSFLYPNYVTQKFPAIADNSTYLIDEDDDFKLLYDNGIAMFDLTVKKGLLVSESIKLSSSLTKKSLIESNKGLDISSSPQVSSQSPSTSST